MDDSDQDFVVLLKHVRKKPDCSKTSKRKENTQQSQATVGEKRRKTNKTIGAQKVKGQPGTAPVEVSRRTGPESGDAGPSVSTEPSGMGLNSVDGCCAKDKVLSRMQQFKRDVPQKMTHHQPRQTREDPQKMTHHQPRQTRDVEPPFPQPSEDAVESCQVSADSDEALALHLQQELDREASVVLTVDLEDGGVFFCQICQRDVSHMTPEGRTQHINRCLDEMERPASDPPPAAPGLPDCPVCGQRFRSQKSRSSHLKRCSADMGVAPALLLQALQRQREEARRVPQPEERQTGGTKRRAAFVLPAQKKKKKEAEPLDEDTMVALALSSSLLQQRVEQETQERVASTMCLVDAAGKRGKKKKKKGTVARPPPLLLVQDAAEALRKLQERVSALLLRHQEPSPPQTPTLCPSSLSAWSGSAPLWQRSALLTDTAVSEFYSSELQEFIQPWKLPQTEVSSDTDLKPSLPPASESTPVTKATWPLPGSQASCSSAPSTPGTEALPLGSQSLRDLMDLAEDGLTFTQCGFSVEGVTRADTSSQASTHLQPGDSKHRVSGFLPEPEPCSSGRAAGSTEAGHHPGALSRLSRDLSSMVNNPQLSDVQLQVDSGEVFFAHSFMVYTRCPLLAQMVHEGAFGVKEEGTAAAQRVLVADVPGEAVLALLQFLYTARVSVTDALLPHVLDLASRFDLQELQSLCETSDENIIREEPADHTSDRIFMELVQSMWRDEDDRSEDGGREDGEGLAGEVDEVATGEEEQAVNEEELQEIYEFAATQKKKDDDVTEDEKNVSEPLDRSYDRLFSESDGEHREEGAFDSHTPEKEFHSSSKAQLLQSSSSALDDPALSPRTSNLPVAGESPPEVLQEEPMTEEIKRESRGPRRIRSPTPPAREEPELIVLSDSGDDVEAELPDPLGSSSSPARISHERSRPPSSGPRDAAEASCGRPEDCSPEVSWLVPSTPLQHRRGSGDVRRTQLFPRCDASSSSTDHDASLPPSSSLQHTPRHQPEKVYSSTPLSLDQPTTLPAASPLLAASPEEMGSFHLDRLSEEASSEKDLHLLSLKSSSDGGERRNGDEESEARRSPQNFSFMDEPPMAFNDSWGLDVCSDAPQNPGRFSLRLDDSGDRGQSSNQPAGSSSPFNQEAQVHGPEAGNAESPTTSKPTPEVVHSLVDSRLWDSWAEEAEPVAGPEQLPARLRTPVAALQRRRLAPVTPMPHFSDMDTPELKNKLNRFGVRALPKRQMVLKLKEIHQYTHQLLSSDSDDQPSPVCPDARTGPTRTGSVASVGVAFKEPGAPAAAGSPFKRRESEKEAESLSVSQDSNTSSTSGRSNPEFCSSSDSDSDAGVSASQAPSRLQDRLQAVRSFILSDPELHSRVLQYQPLVLFDLKQRLKDAGVRLGAAKLMDFLDSQCITFTSARPGQPVPTRRRVKKNKVTGKRPASIKD